MLLAKENYTLIDMEWLIVKNVAKNIIFLIANKARIDAVMILSIIFHGLFLILVVLLYHMKEMKKW